MANKVWTVEHMQCFREYAGHENVVTHVHWRCAASEGPHTASAVNIAIMPLDELNPFTQYDDLTEATVLGWVKDVLGEEAIENVEAAVDSQLADLVSPPIITLPLPWAAAPEEEGQ